METDTETQKEIEHSSKSVTDGDQTAISIALFDWMIPLEGRILTEDAESNSGNGNTELVIFSRSGHDRK